MEKITVNNWSLVKPEKLEGHWITGEEIGRHLGYSEPRISISTLYNRYKESFQEGLDCSVINLITEAGARDMRVFSRRGVLKVIRHSNTAVADKVMDEVFDVYLAVRAKAKARAASSMALFPTPEQEATSIMSAWLKAAALLEVPKYYAQAEGVCLPTPEKRPRGNKGVDPSQQGAVDLGRKKTAFQAGHLESHLASDRGLSQGAGDGSLAISLYRTPPKRGVFF
jgi:prophage antirepressor-like protein